MLASTSFGAIVSDELAKDIEAIVALAPKHEQGHVDNYLRNGAAAESPQAAAVLPESAAG